MRLTDAKRELLARGVEVVDFGIGEPREDTPPFIREAVAGALQPKSTYPLADGPAGAAGRDRRVDRAALRAGARPRHRGPPHARLQGGDLPPRAGGRRRLRRGHHARLPGGRARRGVRRQAGARAAAAGRARLPARPRRGRLVARRDPVAQLPEQPDRRHARRSSCTSAPRRSRASTTSWSPPTRRTREIYFGREPPASALQVADRRNVIALNTLSKRSSMPGYRSGSWPATPR